MTSPGDIAHTFTTFLRNRYDILDVDDECVNTMDEAARPDQTTTYGEILEKHIDTAEIYNATRSGGGNRAPGNDGVGLELYTVNWTVIREDLCKILNQMFTAGTITPKQKHGAIVCLLKPHGMHTPGDYRPITLLNTYLLTYLLTYSLTPWSRVLLEKLTGFAASQ